MAFSFSPIGQLWSNIKQWRNLMTNTFTFNITINTEYDICTQFKWLKINHLMSTSLHATHNKQFSSCHRGQKIQEVWGASPPTLKICHCEGQKWQCNVTLQGSLLDPGPSDQILLLKKAMENFCRDKKPLTLSKNILKLCPWLQ